VRTAHPLHLMSEEELIQEKDNIYFILARFRERGVRDTQYIWWLERRAANCRMLTEGKAKSRQK